MIKMLPNMLTFSRLVLTVVFLVMMFRAPGLETNQALFLDIAFVIFVVAGLTDMIDGTVARKLGVASKFGRIMDPLADKILVCGAFICFAIIGEPGFFSLSGFALAVIHWSVAVILILREIGVTFIRHLAEARGIEFAATVSGKIKMFVQSFAIGTVVIKMAHVQDAAWGNWVASIVYILMVAVTVYSGFKATQRSIKISRS
jgi:CDP-diacylglycerol--glycerol-3-phosphate 3-phosphatidyltransferase